MSKRKKLHPAIKFPSQRHCLKKATRSICKLSIKGQKQQSGKRNIELRRNVNIIKRSFINKFISFFSLLTEIYPAANSFVSSATRRSDTK